MAAHANTTCRWIKTQWNEKIEFLHRETHLPKATGCFIDRTLSVCRRTENGFRTDISLLTVVKTILAGVASASRLRAGWERPQSATVSSVWLGSILDRTGTFFKSIGTSTSSPKKRVLSFPIKARYHHWKIFLLESQHISRIESWTIWAVTLLIRCYQLVLSPLLGSVCRFSPSCSSYAIEAFQRHGLIKGSVLAVKRLLRCHPWNEGGYDPVP